MKASLFFVPLFAASAYAHGFVRNLNVGGKDYKGSSPSDNPSSSKASVIRQIQNTNPVHLSDGNDLICGRKAASASLQADANPGDELAFTWDSGDGGNWPHDMGPLITYMASCGDQTCDKFDVSQAKWFKISQDGQTSGDNWVQGDLMKGAPAKSKIPDNIKPGNYLIRHEIIALHLADQKNGAEFYPSCSQVKIGGNGNGAPKDDETISFPGGYSANDPGIYTPKIFDGGFKYVFPGPPIASFVSGGGNSGSGGSGSGSSGNDNTSATVTKTSSAPRPTKSSNNNASSGSAPSKCSLKKNSKNGNKKNDYNKRSVDVKPRHISRVMRDLTFGASH